MVKKSVKLKLFIERLKEIMLQNLMAIKIIMEKNKIRKLLS